MDDLKMILKKSNFEMGSLDKIEAFKTLSRKDFLDLEKFNTLEPLFIEAQSYMKDHGVKLYIKLEGLP
jgi:hypothetical protein